MEAVHWICLVVSAIFWNSITLSYSRILYNSILPSKIGRNDFGTSTNYISPELHEIMTNEIFREDYKRSRHPHSPSRTQKKCNLPRRLIREIRSYENITNAIIEKAVKGSFQNRTYNSLSLFVDKFGSRLAGSENLEDSIDFVMEKMKNDGLQNVHGEEVAVPHWIRGEEHAELISPRRKKLEILGLGYTVGTPPLGLEADVFVVSNFDDLKENASKVRGKIVLFNEQYVSYDKTVKYRDSGVVEAAKHGALAALIRSVTPFSINSPHTGMMDYSPNVTRIPAACITVEDAELMHRMQERGWKVRIRLTMGAMTFPKVTSRNTIGEIVGKENPDEVVVVSGHIDSWDVGQGAMDDGGGAFISIEALALLKSMDLTPRRTLRSILWTAEEFGLIGVQEYVRRHKNELDKFNAVFESDIGTFRPTGLDFSGTFNAGCIVEEILKLFEPIKASMFRSMPEVGSDIGYFIEQGVPGLSLNNQNDKYFYFHHSEGDTMVVENPQELDLCTAFWAASSYIVADLSISLPRE